MLVDDLAGASLVFGVHVRVQEAHGDRLDAVGPSLFESAQDVLGVELGVRLARGEDPLVDLEREVPRDEGYRPLEEQVVGLGSVPPADLVDVARATRNEQRRTRALPLDRGVDRDRRTVNELGRGGGGDPALFEAARDSVGNGSRVGVGLALIDRIGEWVVRHEVGEGTTDVGCDEGHRFTAFRRSIEAVVA